MWLTILEKNVDYYVLCLVFKFFCSRYSINNPSDNEKYILVKKALQQHHEQIRKGNNITLK
jgi:hypothetical protein